ncbi:MAG TPA: hypothetical protein VFK78_02525 [Gemmatimonadales bacterium]|nr:hypothetical protein [Gemmatimonadales bacterium]
MILALAALLVQGQVVNNAELGFKVTVPEGFAVYPEARSQPDVVECWNEAAPAAASGGLMLCVQRLHGVLDRDEPKPEDIPAGGRLVHFKWKAFDVDGVRTDTAQAGVPLEILVAQVPLKPEAIQLIVTGPRDQSSRLDATMNAALASLDGETNWLTAEERSGRLGSTSGAAAIAVVLIVAAAAIRKRRRRAAGR